MKMQKYLRELFKFTIFAPLNNKTKTNIFAQVMKISGVTIEGISNIEHIGLSFESMNALIAPNGYGKSNVLRAIGFGIKFLTATEQGNHRDRFH